MNTPAHEHDVTIWFYFILIYLRC